MMPPIDPNHEPCEHVRRTSANATDGHAETTPHLSQSDALFLAEQLSRVAYELRDACDGFRDIDEVVEVVSQLRDVAGRLGGVYDYLAQWLWAADCPVKHAAGRFIKTADDLRMAGASCRYAQTVLTEALE